MQFYTDPSREDSPTSLPDAEVFYVGLGNRSEHFPVDANGIPQPIPHGWYWWPRLPNRLPSGDTTYVPDYQRHAVGPFNTEALAIADAREGAAC